MFKFSYFKGPITNTKTCEIVTLGRIVETIRSDKSIKERIELIRSLPEGDKQKAEKNKLPYVCFSGTFKKRESESLIAHSGLICIDIDHLTNERIKEKQELIRQYYEPALMFVSPRGNGLKVVFAIDLNEGTHQEYYNTLSLFLRDILKKEVDPAPANVASACFLSYDPEVYFNETPDILNREFLSKVDTPVIVDNSPDEGSLFTRLKEWTDSKVGFKEGNRNYYITTLAGACNRFGISENYTLNQLTSFANNGFSIKEIEDCIKSIYKNIQWFGSAKTLQELETPYIRVGTSFYKVILKTDRHGIDRKELKVWNQATLIQDHKRSYIKNIPRFDDFVMVPDNLQLKPVINNCYNLYAPFNHVPAPGPWLWTERLLKHVFAEQYDLGLRYMQILYLHPDHSTVILCLVSKERGTGKSTFVNWINMLFGSNVALISSTDFLSGFNSHYATKNIVCIEETLFEKRLTIEKLKALATAKYIQINEKFVVPYKIPFYGKIILTSNNEERFVQIDDEEIRFFVRKLGTPEFTNHNIESNLLEEIPAFLNYLQSLPPVDWTVSRSGFTGKELVNQALYNVVLEGRSSLAKDLELLITDFFDNNEVNSFFASPIDIKNKFFPYDNRTGISWLLRILKENFKMIPEEMQRYTPFGEPTNFTKTGKPYNFLREDFTKEILNNTPF